MELQELTKNFVAKYVYPRNGIKEVTSNNVKSLINTTMKKGATTLINKQGRALIYEAVRNNVVVRYAVIDGVIKISDAWVKTR